MTDTTYNGWTNYETWLVNLWIDTEEGSQAYWRDEAQTASDNPTPNPFIESRADRARITLSVQLKNQFEERASELVDVTGFWADLLGAALSAVNWREIAEHVLADVEESATA